LSNTTMNSATDTIASVQLFLRAVLIPR